jgi:hypothetical protein
MNKDKVKKLLREIIPWLIMAAGLIIISFGHKNILLIFPGLFLVVLGYKKGVKKIKADMWPAYLEDLESLLQRGTTQDNEGYQPATDEKVGDFISRMLKKVNGVNSRASMHIVEKVLTLLKQYRPWLHAKLMKELSSINLSKGKFLSIPE